MLKTFPEGWETRRSRKTYGNLSLTVLSAADLLAGKARRNEPRDKAHAAWARALGLV